MNSLMLQSLIPFLVISSFLSSIFEESVFSAPRCAAHLSISAVHLTRIFDFFKMDGGDGRVRCIIFDLPVTLCADDPQYANCSQAINCGDISNISYPFWGVNRPNYCGQPGFEIKCQDNVPMINMRNIDFSILEMNSSSTARAVKVARNDYWGTICPPTYVNTNINFSLFNYGSGLQNTSFTTDVILLQILQCEVLIPVLETAALAIESNTTTIQEAMDGGFVLGLKIDNGPCNSCEASGGKCGMNTSNGEFMCFCQDQPYAATTCSSKSGSTSLSVSASQLAFNNMTVLFSTPESNRDLGSLDLCKYEVSIPVLETAALALENRSTTVQVAINGGFELALQIDNGPCIICEASGGKCGVNTDNGRFMCFCQDRPYAASTCSSSLPGFVTGTSVR
ncbi:hypothetical protein ACLB2K_054263 [Fragaria x ananassa]